MHNPGTPCIMAVDDDRILLAKLRATLSAAGYQLIDAPCAEAALALLTSTVPDLVLLDVSMPGMSGLDLALYLRGRSIAFLFLSASDDAAIARDAAACGALGYLVKPADIRHVLPAIETALQRAEEIHRLQRRLQQAQARISVSREEAQVLLRIANEDALTGLPNRNWLLTFLPRAMASARRDACMFALLYMDLDGFKAINDDYGHAVGDELLQAAAFRLRAVLKPGDHIARLGGDEFVALVAQVSQESDAAHVAARLADALDNPFELSCARVAIGISVGIALYPRDAVDADGLLRAADRAMYSAKARKGAGKLGAYRFYAPELAKLRAGS
jgi:diguanylate cyclase (GGDEF)-like protein